MVILEGNPNGMVCLAMVREERGVEVENKGCGSSYMKVSKLCFAAPRSARLPTPGNDNGHRATLVVSLDPQPLCQRSGLPVPPPHANQRGPRTHNRV